jgi:hypothetical protein
MDQNKFVKKSIKIIGSTGIEHSIECYVDPDYEFKTYPDTSGSKTGHVVFAELKPHDGLLPVFKLRWDHGDKVVDVDVFQKNEPRNDLWNLEGYKGHHADKIDEMNYEYSFLIKIPGRKIFEVSIKVGLLIGLNLHDNLHISEKNDIKII